MDFNTWEDYREQIDKTGELPEDWYVLGIDLGTTNSVISYWDSSTKRPEAIDVSNGFGKIPLPSVVQFRSGCRKGELPIAEEDEWVIGEEAYRSYKLYPESTVRSIKRKMGTNEVVSLGGMDYLPEAISAKILAELVQHCQNLNPKAEIAGVVVGVPYDFDDAAKKATIKACELAGFGKKLICLIEEPKAAALAYNFRHSLEQGEKIMVFDFGGGTLDITVFHVAEKSEASIRVKVISEGGEAHHGGDNIDETLLEKCYTFIQSKTGQAKDEITADNQAELIVRTREAKERLSGVKSFRIPFTFCIPPFVENYTREQFEHLISPFMEKTRKLVVQVLREAYDGAINPNDINRVLLEGGSAAMPWVKQMLIGIFNDEGKIYSSEKPALDISTGAAYYAAMKMGLLDSPELVDEQLHAGVVTDRPQMMVNFETTIPHDIGFEIEKGDRKTFFAMVKRGTPYALAKKSHVFTLAGDSAEDMTELGIRILERMNKQDTIEKCKLIGDVKIAGLPTRPSGKTRLRVTLSVEEENGLVRGMVEDMGFGDEFVPSGYKQGFEPRRYGNTVIYNT